MGAEFSSQWALVSFQWVSIPHYPSRDGHTAVPQRKAECLNVLYDITFHDGKKQPPSRTYVQVLTALGQAPESPLEGKRSPAVGAILPYVYKMLPVFKAFPIITAVILGEGQGNLLPGLQMKKLWTEVMQRNRG